MGFDNRIFNVNGKEKEHFVLTVKLAFALSGSNTTTKAFQYIKGKGLVFYWHAPQGKDVIEIMREMNAEQTAEYVWAWLEKSKEAKEELLVLSERSRIDEDYQESISNSRWDEDCDHDGFNSVGWRVFVEDWGHVNGNWETIACVKPVFVWHGR